MNFWCSILVDISNVLKVCWLVVILLFWFVWLVYLVVCMFWWGWFWFWRMLVNFIIVWSVVFGNCLKVLMCVSLVWFVWVCLLIVCVRKLFIVWSGFLVNMLLLSRCCFIIICLVGMVCRIEFGFMGRLWCLREIGCVGRDGVCFFL